MKIIQLYHSTEFALVDNDLYTYLSKFTWYKMQGLSTVYASTIIGDKTILMHQLVLPSNCPELTPDHKDGNGLNNQSNNLRLATHSQQHQNQRKWKKKTSSKYKGVSFCKRENKWRAYIKLKGVSMSLGYFTSESLAAQAYNYEAKKLFGEFAKLNTIELGVKND